MLKDRALLGGGLMGLLVLAATCQADEATVVKVIEKLGDRVEVNRERTGNPVVGVNFSDTTVTDAVFKELKELKHW